MRRRGSVAVSLLLLAQYGRSPRVRQCRHDRHCCNDMSSEESCARVLSLILKARLIGVRKRAKVEEKVEESVQVSDKRSGLCLSN